MAAAKAVGVLCMVLAFSRIEGVSVNEAAGGANPIRKVVTLMQNMQKEIQVEGEKEKEIFDKFMCYCQGNEGDLAKSIADDKAKIDELSAKLKAEEAEKAQTAQELVEHKEDRENAKKELAEATAIREKEAADFATLSTDMKTNLEAMGKAIPALEKGMGAASLLQLPAVGRLVEIANSFAFSNEGDRQMLQEFLQSGTSSSDEALQDYEPASGQIVGILKQMEDETNANLAEATKNEEQSAAAFTNLKASKEQEVSVASSSIETKQTRAGELAVTVVETKDDLEDTQAEVADTEKFAGGLKEQCAAKTKEWAERQKTRADEVAAISEAIGILNDDDALDLFKKTIPAALMQQPGYSLLQRSATRMRASSVHRAYSLVKGVMGQKGTHKGVLQLMLFTLSSKLRLQTRQKAAMSSEKFEEVTHMVDEMVTLEGKEQAEDDHEQPWCNGEFDKSAHEESVETTEIGALKAEIDEETDDISSLEEEIKTLSTEIANLDKAVVEATDQRKEEHSDYLETTQLSLTAIGLVEKAKNRLNKFYNPTVYKEEPAAAAFLQVVSRVHSHRKVAPAEAPEGFGAYEKKSGKSSGVIALMDSILKELENDIKNAEYEEKTAQKDYEELMSDSADTRVQKIKSITDKEAAKAKVGEKKEMTTEKEKADEVDVEHIQKYVKDLHGQCDFILENYDTRKTARATEVEALKNAKAVLSGAIM